MKSNHRVLITGTSGFIGFHLAKLLLDRGFKVHGIDNKNPYYDINLKQARSALLKKYDKFSECEKPIEDKSTWDAIEEKNYGIVIHLAAQAGVRYSIDHPEEYVSTNLIGTFNVLEYARNNRVKHLLMASTSSVYGSNTQMPFDENQKCDHQMSFYAATKKSNEAMAHSYAHLFDIPITMFRFFTVYGPWGRPDMALFKFVSAISKNQPIDVYNNGKMKRDFTYVEDLCMAVCKLMDVAPARNQPCGDGDSLSPVAPFRVVNIGNSQAESLMRYISEIESNLGKEANINFMPMQAGDVAETIANTDLLKKLTGYRPTTSINTGIAAFCDWYFDYYK